MENSSPQPTSRGTVERQLLDRLSASYRRSRSRTERRHFMLLAAVLAAALAAQALHLSGNPSVRPYGHYSSSLQKVDNITSQLL